MRQMKRDGSETRKVLIGMIMDDAVLSRIASKWQSGMFSNKWANIVANWCVDFYHKYDKAPGQAIESLFAKWAKRNQDEDSEKLIEKFLSSLSKQYEAEQHSINPDHLVDLAAQHFNRNRIKQLSKATQQSIDVGNVDEALQKIHEFRHVELTAESAIDVLNDEASIHDLFADTSNNIIKYPGAAGQFFDGNLRRGDFVSFMAQEKGGKSFWLLDIAWRAMQQRRKVLFLSVGDMTKREVLRRMVARATHRPFKRATIEYPKSLKRRRGKPARVKREKRVYRNRMSKKQCFRALAKVRKVTRSTGSLLRLSCHANYTINIEGVAAVCEVLTKDGWSPDVLVIDYADLLSPPAGIKEPREQINVTWKKLRALSQQLHCLVVTATQANAAAYSANKLSMKHFSEDKRKLAHVTGMIGIVCSSEEYKRQIRRLNWIALRENESDDSRFLYTAGCLGIANPCVRSCW